MASEILTAERLRELLHYDPDTGIFTRKVKTSNHARMGGPLGTPCNGYVVFSVLGSQRYAHRMAWLYVYGDWPKVIDHINSNRADNRIANLRSVVQKTNLENQRLPRSDNTSGFLGVSRVRSGKWRATIMTNKKAFNLGHYDTPEEAYQVYLTKKRELHEGCTI